MLSITTSLFRRQSLKHVNHLRIEALRPSLERIETPPSVAKTVVSLAMKMRFYSSRHRLQATVVQIQRCEVSGHVAVLQIACRKPSIDREGIQAGINEILQRVLIIAFFYSSQQFLLKQDVCRRKPAGVHLLDPQQVLLIYLSPLLTSKRPELRLSQVIGGVCKPACQKSHRPSASDSRPCCDGRIFERQLDVVKASVSKGITNQRDTCDQEREVPRPVLRYPSRPAQPRYFTKQQKVRRDEKDEQRIASEFNQSRRCKSAYCDRFVVSNPSVQYFDVQGQPPHLFKGSHFAMHQPA